MRALLIDPIDKKITEVEHNQKNWRDILYQIECNCMTTVYVNEKEVMYLDDEGLLLIGTANPPEFFVWKGYNQPLANKALILGYNEEGDSTPSELTLEYVKEHVTFITQEDAIMRLNHGGIYHM